jgi:hypothetical protein
MNMDLPTLGSTLELAVVLVFVTPSLVKRVNGLTAAAAAGSATRAGGPKNMSCSMFHVHILAGMHQDGSTSPLGSILELAVVPISVKSSLVKRVVGPTNAAAAGSATRADGPNRNYAWSLPLF